jgi:hypothetical protein
MNVKDSYDQFDSILQISKQGLEHVWPHLFYTLLLLLSGSRAKHDSHKVLKLKSVFFIMKKKQYK